MNLIDVNIQTRQNVLELLSGLDGKQWNEIPQGFSNNLIWNVGHCMVTQQLLQYKLSGVSMKVPKAWVNEFRKGSKPERSYSLDEIEEILYTYSTLLSELKKDMEKELFTKYMEYETSYGVTLTSLDDAIAFNNVHEGVHFGVIMALRKLV